MAISLSPMLSGWSGQLGAMLAKVASPTQPSPTDDPWAAVALPATPAPAGLSTSLLAPLATAETADGKTPADAQPAPASAPTAAAPSALDAAAQADKDAIAAIPKLSPMQFSPVQHGPVDIGKLISIAQQRQRLGTAR